MKFENYSDIPEEISEFYEETDIDGEVVVIKRKYEYCNESALDLTISINSLEAALGDKNAYQTIIKFTDMYLMYLQQEWLSQFEIFLKQNSKPSKEDKQYYKKDEYGRYVFLKDNFNKALSYWKNISPKRPKVYDSLEYILLNYRKYRVYPDFNEYLDGVVKEDKEQIDNYFNECRRVKNFWSKLDKDL